MPTYDYRCEANGKLYEVKHPMSMRISTWGELKVLADIEDDVVPDSTPVSKVLNIGGVVKSSALKNAEPACPVSGCGGGRCQFQ